MIFRLDLSKNTEKCINFMKIVVVGLGYVGVSNAVLLAQHNEVIGVDISQTCGLIKQTYISN